MLAAGSLMLALASCGGNQSNGEKQETGPDTVTTASGLKYVITKEGQGETPATGDKVSVHYTGTLASTGEKFDSSRDRNQPFQFQVGIGQVIPGWDEGIMMLPKGTQATLIIPADLAYGSTQRPGIPANSDLVFDVEIMDIQPGPKPIEHQPFAIDGVEKQTTPSGLEYYIVEKSEGTKAEPGRMVKVHYAGYFEDGKMFDSSFERGEPIQLQLGAGQVIPGWDEGIALLKEGEKAKLVIPSNLAYGETGYPPVIPANATLTFDVYLVEVQ